MIDYFDRRGARLKVVYFTRDPLGVVPSLLRQFIKGGMTDLPVIPLDYRSAIMPFFEALPANQIVVRDYRTEIESHGDIVEAFANICGIDISGLSNKRSNESLSLVGTKLVRRFNKLPVNSFGGSAQVRARQKLIDFISKVYPRDSAGTIKPGIVAGLTSMSAADTDFLRQTFGISYEVVTGGAALRRCNAYFDDLTDVDLAAFREVLNGMGIALRTDDTIDSLLIQVYYHFLGGPSLHDDDASELRDISIKIAEGGDLMMDDAVTLMALALRARPNGPFIRQKLDEYRRRSRL